MSSSKPFCVDFDDLCDVTAETLETVRKLSEEHAGFKCTLYTIPRRTSSYTINAALDIPGVQLAPHGWRHTRGECLGWSDEEAEAKIKIAARMGIDAPVFRAPGWLVDKDVYDACDRLSYAVASHETFRVPNTGVREYVYNKHSMYFRGVHGHLSNTCGNYIQTMLDEGHLDFPKNAQFVHPQDVAQVLE